MRARLFPLRRSNQDEVEVRARDLGHASLPSIRIHSTSDTGRDESSRAGSWERDTAKLRLHETGSPTSPATKPETDAEESEMMVLECSKCGFQVNSQFYYSIHEEGCDGEMQQVKGKVSELGHIM